MSTAADTDQPGQAGEHEVSDEQRDNTVLSVMLCEELKNYPWTVDEIARTIHSRVGATDAVRRLEAAGLLHRIGFVWPSLAARRADELER